MNKQQWEYLVETNDSTFSLKINGVKYASIVDYLNERGKDGWQLCDTDRGGNYYFKRPIQ